MGISADSSVEPIVEKVSVGCVHVERSWLGHCPCIQSKYWTFLIRVLDETSVGIESVLLNRWYIEFHYRSARGVDHRGGDSTQCHLHRIHKQSHMCQHSFPHSRQYRKWHPSTWYATELFVVSQAKATGMHAGRLILPSCMAVSLSFMLPIGESSRSGSTEESIFAFSDFIQRDDLFEWRYENVGSDSCWLWNEDLGMSDHSFRVDNISLSSLSSQFMSQCCRIVHHLSTQR